MLLKIFNNILVYPSKYTYICKQRFNNPNLNLIMQVRVIINVVEGSVVLSRCWKGLL